MRKHPAVKLITPVNENGFASLVIAIVLVLVLSLITVGFAELMRHEERSALDKQLSSQAYYAAESGINAATQAINEGYRDIKPDCGPNSTLPEVLRTNTVSFSDADASNPTNASYPCLLINPAPPSLFYNPINTTVSRTGEFTAINSANQPTAVDKIKIAWQDSGNNKTFVSPDCSHRTPAADWTAIGMVRVQLTPVTAALDRDTLTNSTMTSFLCPNVNNGHLNVATYNTDHSTTSSGSIYYGNCRASSTPNCSMTIEGLPANQTTFFINLRSLYAATAITVTAQDSTGATLRLKGAQTLIDSTGKAQDVLRRIQVRVSSTNGYDIPDGTHGGDICKQFDLDPAVTTPSPASASAGCTTTSLTY